MRQVNVPVEDDVYEAAKVEAARRGMIFKKFVELALQHESGAGRVEPNNSRQHQTDHERPYEPIED